MRLNRLARSERLRNFARKTASVLHVNSPKNYVIGFLALTTLGGAILAWQQYGELVELRAGALNREERADLHQRVKDLEQMNRALQDQLAALRGAEDLDSLIAANADTPNTERGTRGERGRGGDSRGRGGSDGRQQFEAIRELMAKPEVQAMLSVQQKAAIEARYSALFKNLNLNAEQTDKLKTLLAERGNTRRDVEEAARAQGINPRENPEAYRKLFTDAQNELNAGIKAVIGDAGFAQLQTYEQTLPQRSLVENLQQRLSSTNLPLTSAQAEQLVQILAANSPQRTTGTTTGTTAQPGTAPSGRGPSTFGGGDFGRGGPPDIGRLMGGGFGGPPPGMGGGTATVTAAAVSQAQTILAPPQLAALQQIQQQQQTQQQLQQLVRDTLAANAAATKTGTPTTGTTGAGSGAPAPTRKRGGGG